jgi:putative transposase
MSPLLLPFQLALLMFSGWVNRHQLDVIEYLQEENRVLKERLGGQRIRFTDVERRRLARKAQLLGRKVLKELETLVTPDTLPLCDIDIVSLPW